MTTRKDLGWFNGLPVDVAEAELLTCCAARAWARLISAQRPYGDLAALRSAGAAAVRELEWADVEEALGAHPRIGARVQGADREAGWSRGEQAGMDAAAAGLRAAMVEGNQAYEQRFDHVFLICASGRSAAELLDELNERLGNDVAAERRVVRAELAKITELRLGKLIAEEGR